MSRPIRIMRSREFMVQIFLENDGSHRLSFNRTMIDKYGHYIDGLTWDDLDQLKRQAGYGDKLAVEFYPPERDIVNVANMRHLFVVNQFGAMPAHWVKSQAA